VETQLSRSEIEANYQNEWILIADPETNAAMEIVRGKVLWHSQNRDEVYRKAKELKPKSFALLYTGELAPDAAVVV
jgi:hypothetical protein